MTRVPLFDRLPAIHKIKDAELAGGTERGPLQAYLSHVEDAFSAVKDSIEALYHDLFIDTCAEWVIPYIGDLLGTSHLAGDPWTLRLDVADTILLRRAKGTLGAIERLARDLTGWGAHPVELRENLVWAQALNHQRPDRGGLPAYGDMPAGRHTVIRGGFATVRDPAALSLLGTPFDRFARFPDISVVQGYRVGYNLPNLAIFLWRLATYRIDRQVHLVSPAPAIAATGNAAPLASHVARFFVDPLARVVRLFGRSGYDPARHPPVVTPVDAQPAPIPRARLTTPPQAGKPGSFAGNPEAYVSAVPYDETLPSSLAVSDLPLQLHVPKSLGPIEWTFRGANLCAWEAGLVPPLELHEIAIDPVTGRMAIGTSDPVVAQALVDHLVLTYTYAAVGPVGAQATNREAVTGTVIGVDQQPGSLTLADALAGLADDTVSAPLVIELRDSEVHDLDVSTVTGAVDDGGWTLVCGRPLVLRAGDGQRPIVRLAQPLRLRAKTAAIAWNTQVQFEGITFVAGTGFAATDPLIARAAVTGLDLRETTLDPGGSHKPDGTRLPPQIAMRLALADAAFELEPRITVTRSITGALFVDPDVYTLHLTGSIIDGAGAAIAIAGAGDPTTTVAVTTVIDGVTIFGATRVEQISGRGGIFDGTLFVDDDQSGCLKYCWFSGNGDRLPQNTGSVRGPDARLAFTSEAFGHEAYGQLALEADRQIRERGPGDDQMGAFGFLFEAHRWTNLTIRLREFMPAGVRPLLIPAT
jgi:hypothetical protein